MCVRVPNALVRRCNIFWKKWFKKKKRALAQKQTFIIRIYQIHPSDPSRSLTISFTRQVVTYTGDEARKTAQAVVAIHNRKREESNIEWLEWVVGEIWVKGTKK